MSANCLVTKYKESVNDYTLPILNGIRVQSRTDPNADARYIKYSGGDIDVPENYPLADSSHIASGNYFYGIKKKSNLSELILNGASSVELEEIIGANYLWTLTLTSSYNSGNIESVKDIERVRFVKITNSSNVVGNIEVLSGLINATSLRFDSTKVSGDLFLLAKGQIANGRTTCAGIALGYATPYIKMNGITLERNSECSLSWDSQYITFTGESTIVLDYDGNVIN